MRIGTTLPPTSSNGQLNYIGVNLFGPDSGSAVSFAGVCKYSSGPEECVISSPAPSYHVSRLTTNLTLKPNPNPSLKKRFIIVDHCQNGGDLLCQKRDVQGTKCILIKRAILKKAY